MWQKLLGALNPSLMIKNAPIPAEELRSSVGASERLSHWLQ